MSKYCFHYSSQKTELQKIESGEVKRLKQEVNRLKETLSTKQLSHDAELDGMRSEVTKLTSELHERNVTFSTLTDKSSTMERQLRNENEILEKKSAELQVCILSVIYSFIFFAKLRKSFSLRYQFFFISIESRYMKFNSVFILHRICQYTVFHYHINLFDIL